MIKIFSLICRIAFAAGILFFFIKKRQRIKSISAVSKYGLIASLVCSLLLAQVAFSLCPPLTDSVTITALVKKNEAAQTDEIWISGIFVDGKIQDIPVPISGKWFWIGENYVWRNENDSRQPEGTTRSIIIDVPIGTSRSIKLRQVPYGGICNITTLAGELIVDTYAESDSVLDVELGSSSYSARILGETRALLLFMLVFALCCLFIWLGARLYGKSDSLRKETWRKYCRENAICAIIAILALALMVLRADTKSLWSDEMGQVAFAMSGIRENIEFCLNMRDIAPPLYDICCSLWYRIAPYGEQWLLLISIIPTAASIYVTGRICTTITENQYAGILASTLMATSLTTWMNVAYELRTYSFAVFFTAVSLYVHIKRETGRRWEWIFSISITMLAMSHYFAMMACGMFFLADLYLVIKKRMSFRQLCRSYLLPGIITVSWLTAVYVRTLQFKSADQIANWYVVPGVQEVKNLLFFLSGNQNLTYALLLIGLAAALVWVFSSQKEEHDKKIFYCGFSAITILAVISALLLYGNFVNQESTMWEQRYFLFLTPLVWLLASVWISCVVEKINLFCAKYMAVYSKTLCLFLGIMLSMEIVINVSNAGWPVEPYRESADWLYEQGNEIYNDDTAVIVTTPDYVRDGWYEYYLREQGRRDPINCYSQSEFYNPLEDLACFNTIYVQYSLVGLTPSLYNALMHDFDMQADYQNLNIYVFTRKLSNSIL